MLFESCKQWRKPRALARLNLHPSFEGKIRRARQPDIGKLAILLVETHFELVSALDSHLDRRRELVNPRRDEG
jgi:hypothetical protein